MIPPDIAGFALLAIIGILTFNKALRQQTARS